MDIHICIMGKFGRRYDTFNMQLTYGNPLMQ